MSLEEQVARSFERWRDPIYRYLLGAQSTPYDLQAQLNGNRRATRNQRWDDRTPALLEAV